VITVSSILNLAQFQLREMPPGWQAQAVGSTLGSELVVQEFYLQAEPDVKFHYFYRGKPLSKIVADEFVELLSQAPHALSDEEFSNIEMVVRDASEPEFFEMLDKHTETLGGRNGLVVEGIWKFSDVQDLGIFITGTDARVIDELHFTAPKQLFQQFKASLQDILSLVEWRQERHF